METAPANDSPFTSQRGGHTRNSLPSPRELPEGDHLVVLVTEIFFEMFGSWSHNN